MDKKDFEEFLKNRYYQQIDWYDRKAARNHWAYKILQSTLIILSAITPVLVVVGGALERWLAVFISALVAIEASTLKVFKFQENWINYRTTCETLRKEIHYYKAKIYGYGNTDDPEALFVDGVETLISREHTLWLVSHKREEAAVENV